jgi:hypothetical protein
MLNGLQCVLAFALVLAACESKLPKTEALALAATDQVERANNTLAPSPTAPVQTEAQATSLDTNCKWMDLWHPSFKRLRNVARRYLERSEATDLPPQMLCCTVAPGHALCKVWQTWHFSEVYSANNTMVQMGSSVRLVGVTDGESEAWLDTNLMVAEHGRMGEPDTPLMRPALAIQADGIVLLAQGSSCPRPCGKHCYLVERLARDTCEVVGRYQLIDARWQKR